MENTAEAPQITINDVYPQAANMLIGGQNTYEVKNAIMARGLDERSADELIGTIEDQINTARRSRAKKDMLFGALWCIGGLGLTLADVGFIFWGAIVFGAIQFIKGAKNY